MINYYYVIDLVHHSNNKKLLSYFDQNKSVFSHSCSLFSSLLEHKLIHISPILCQIQVFESSIIKSFLENKSESILFIASSLTLNQLSNHLQRYMDFTLSDGRTGIIRLYDPRTFRNFNNMLTTQQKKQFWENIAYIKGWDDINNDYYTEEYISNV